MTPKLIAITGGIGSGKSVVSQLLRVMGYTVYDCDERAKWVMTHDAQLRSALSALFGPSTYLPTGSGNFELNKSYLSARIFSDNQALAQMNACVHPAVWRDMQTFLMAEPKEYFFFESAILFESGFDRLAHPDVVWTVSAPLEGVKQLRIDPAEYAGYVSVEDIGIALGAAFKKAIGDKAGIRRYGSIILPMDETLILCAVDISGRGELRFNVPIPAAKVGTFDTELCEEFFKAFSRTAELTLHLRELDGSNSHHIIEAAFKAFARALGEAAEVDPRLMGEVPSTKGVL